MKITFYRRYPEGRARGYRRQGQQTLWKIVADNGAVVMDGFATKAGAEQWLADRSRSLRLMRIVEGLG